MKRQILFILLAFIPLQMPVWAHAEDRLLVAALAQQIQTWDAEVEQGHGARECNSAFHASTLKNSQPAEIIASWEQIKGIAHLCEINHDALGEGLIWVEVYLRLAADDKSKILNRSYLLRAINNMLVLSSVNKLDPGLRVSLIALTTEIVHNNGRFEQVIKLTNIAEAEFKTLGVRKSLNLALAISNKGYAEYRRGDLVASEKELLRAERMLRGLDRLDEAQLAVIYKRLASVYDRMRKPRLAIDYIEKAKLLFDKFGSKIDSANLRFNKGIILLDVGLYDQAIDVFTEARNIYLSLGKEKALGDTFYNLGKAWYFKGNADRALNYYEQSERVLTDTHDYVVLGKLYISMGIFYENQFTEVSYQRAKQYYDMAEKLLLRYGADPGSSLFTLAINRGRLFERWGKYKEANEEYLQAQKRVPEARTQARYIVHNNLAYLALLRKEYDQAFAYAQAALQDLDKTLELEFYIAGAPNIQFIDKNLSSYYIAMQALIQKGEVAKAYALRETSRNRIFQFMVRRRKDNKPARQQDVLWRKKLELDKAVSELDQRAVQSQSDNERSRLLAQRNALKKKLESVERNLFSNPEQYRKIFGSGTLNIQALQSNLKPGEALVDFQVSSRLVLNDVRFQIAAFVVTQRSIKYVNLFPTEDAYGCLEVVKEYNALHRPQSLQRYYSHNTLSSYTKKIQQRANTLYHDLFGKLAGELKGVTKLFIIPDGPLNLLPFETLRDNQNRLLLDKYAISYLNSPSEIYGVSQKANKGLLVFGDIDYGKGVEGKRQWRQITGSAEVLKGINKAMQGKLPISYFHDRQATETQFDQLAPGHRVLLIWSHGEFSEYNKMPAILADAQDEQGGLTFKTSEELAAWRTHQYQRQFSDPLSNSFLALAAINNGGDGINDGYLTAREVMGLDLEGTQLTILAACETGVGQTSPSEGVLGLRKAFSIAGSQQLLISLWQVDAKWTGELIKSMLTQYAALGGARALQNAKQHLIKQLRAEGLEPYPFYWAGFILVGKDQ